jgi:lysophospholipase L1-like esterase
MIVDSQTLAALEREIEKLEQKFVGKSGGNVVFYGSSSIRLWPGLSRAFPDVAIDNLGFGGSTLDVCTYFFERVVVPRSPRGIVFYGGDNDLFLGATPQDVWNSLSQMLDLRDKHLGPVPFAFLSIKPSPARQQLLGAIEETNEWCQREIWNRENAYWVDVFNPMMDENETGVIQPQLFLGDRLHLSRAGYDVWNSVLRDELSFWEAVS